METKPNSTAYPTGDHNDVEPEYGLTKREYFSAKFMQSLIISGQYSPSEVQYGACCDLTIVAVTCADQLIKELNNGSK